MPLSAISVDHVRTETAERLRARLPEIERTVATRIGSVSEPSEVADPTYLEGLRSSLSAALEYSMAVLELGHERTPPIPPILLSQSRAAARNGVRLDVVLRRYVVGYTLLVNLVVEEADAAGTLDAIGFRELALGHSTVLDRLLTAVCEEYTHEIELEGASNEGRRVQQVKRLLAGEQIVASSLGYEMSGTHIGMVASGTFAGDAVRALTEAVDCRHLIVGDGDTIWAWLASMRGLDEASLDRLLRCPLPAEAALALGEPADDLIGWRLTHRQAMAALSIAQQSPGQVVRYTEVALVASVLQDDLLLTSMRELYLRPLNQERDGGELARETLRAYFAVQRNVSSAAALLGVSRQAVSNRLRTIEERLGRPLNSCATELEAMLAVEELAPASIKRRATPAAD